jgi:type I restriction enzyme, R subunit
VQFANSPDLASGIMDAIFDAFAPHSVMSKQALDSEKVRTGVKDVLLGPAQLYEALRARGRQYVRADFSDLLASRGDSERQHR